MGRSLRKAHHFHADESGWHLFTKLDDKGNYNWPMWVFISTEYLPLLFIYSLLQLDSIKLGGWYFQPPNL